MNDLIMESLNINYIDESEYPSTTDIQNRCHHQACELQFPLLSMQATHKHLSISQILCARNPHSWLSQNSIVGNPCTSQRLSHRLHLTSAGVLMEVLASGDVGSPCCDAEVVLGFTA